MFVSGFPKWYLLVSTSAVIHAVALSRPLATSRSVTNRLSCLVGLSAGPANEAGRTTAAVLRVVRPIVALVSTRQIAVCPGCLVILP